MFASVSCRNITIFFHSRKTTNLISVHHRSCTIYLVCHVSLDRVRITLSRQKPVDCAYYAEQHSLMHAHQAQPTHGVHSLYTLNSFLCVTYFRKKTSKRIRYCLTLYKEFSDFSCRLINVMTNNCFTN